MGLFAKLTGGQTADTRTGRSLAERAHRAREIRRIDAATSKWLQAGGLAPRRDR